MAWIFLTLLAVVMQTFRNGLQSQLSAHVNTLGVTLSRFIFATPIAVMYLILVNTFIPQSTPTFSTSFYLFVVLAALMQILATSLMVVLFKQRNFAIGAGLAKSEAIVAAILGTLFFGSFLSPLGWLGIIVGAVAVFVLSGMGSKTTLNLKTVMIGLACGGSFALTSLFVREASLALNLFFPHAAAWVLCWVLALQTLLLSAFIYLKQPHVIQQLLQHKKTVLLVSFTSCIGSIGWFSAMSLQHVAYVKTLGQVEVLSTILLSIFWLKQKVKWNEVLGLVLISIAAVLVMWTS